LIDYLTDVEVIDLMNFILEFLLTNIS